ncbi:MAG: hypothetical protein HWD82_07295 [Flavobacteriaceae bacterium]|nr:hypothetical protein [Flavobacteriaceae bacterium]
MKTISIKNSAKNITKLNDLALDKTEKVVNSSFEVIEKAQLKADSLIKKGLQFSDKKQNNIFNALEAGKKSIWKKANKVVDLFSKK